MKIFLIAVYVCLAIAGGICCGPQLVSAAIGIVVAGKSGDWILNSLPKQKSNG